MSFPFLGDLAQSYTLRRQVSQLQVDLSRSSQEIATGRVAEAAPRLGSAMQDYSSLERRLSVLPVDIDIAREALIESEAIQSALGTLNDIGQRLSSNLVGPGTLSGPPALAIVAEGALKGLESILATLNIQVGNRSLFSGVSVGSPAMPSAEQLLALVEGELTTAGATTLEDLTLTVDGFFAPGGVFETAGYLGSTTDRQAQRLTTSQTTDPPPRADDLELRGFLAAATKAALVGRNPLSLSSEDSTSLARQAGVELLGANEGVAAIQARTGVNEERATLAIVELQAEESALKLARTSLIGVDPFAAATELADAEARLEKVYAITARLSRLNLTDFLR